MDDLRPAVESLVDRHPDLSGIRGDPVARSRYVACVLASLFASLHGLTTSRVTMKELCSSNLVDAFLMCSVTTTDNVLPFSIRYFRDVEALYRAVDRANRGTFTLQQLVHAVSPGPVLPLHGAGGKGGGGSTSGPTGGGADDQEGTVGSLPAGQRIVPVCSNALERVFAGRARTLSSGRAGCLNFEDFVWLRQAMQDRMGNTSVEYWFRVLDLDDDGVLGPLDVECSYENRIWQLREMGERQHVATTSAVMQLHDMVSLRGGGDLRCNKLRNSGVTELVFDLLLGVGDRGKAARDLVE